MTTTTQTTTPSKKRTITVFVLTIVFGFILFALPNLFFGIFKVNGGLSGINLLFMGLFQFVAVTALVRYSLKALGKDFRFIGLTSRHLTKDILLGAAVGIAWAVLQFAWLIPATGGAERNDIQQMLTMYDGTMIGLISFIALGIVGGGITEEIYNRGFFINVLKSTFQNEKTGLWVAGIVSVLFFMAGHLPGNAIEWFDILVPTVLYTILFIKTGRLTPSIVAHGLYNMLAIILTYYMYYL